MNDRPSPHRHLSLLENLPFSEELMKTIFLKLCKAKNDNGLSNLRLLRLNLRTYLIKRYGEKITDRMLNFYEVPNSIDFTYFLQFRD